MKTHGAEVFFGLNYSNIFMPFVQLINMMNNLFVLRISAPIEFPVFVLLSILLLSALS